MAEPVIETADKAVDKNAETVKDLETETEPDQTTDLVVEAVAVAKAKY